MGDAGPLTPPPVLEVEIATVGSEHETPLREVTVLVTGFGPFKSFAINPSWLIASSLPSILQSQQQAPEKTSLNGQQHLPRPPSLNYSIRLIVHPSPVRVAYATAAMLFPQLIATHDPDYVLHIGMAGGRDHYTLETIAHRDNYKIKDIDDRDGWRDGEHAWKREEVPDFLHVGWDETDVLKRWENEISEIEDKMGLLDSTPVPTPGGLRLGKEPLTKSVVRLSRDAGRFLCEFALMVSLSRRWVEARTDDNANGSAVSNLDSREGKVAFLHVPGGHTADDIMRGVRVAETAIRSLVGSWEEGRRRADMDERAAATYEEAGRWEGVVWRA